MTNGNWPGLVGRVVDYLCDVRGIDTGLALGGALSVVGGLAAGRYAAPHVGVVPADSEVMYRAGVDMTKARDRATTLGHIRVWGPALVGPEEDCKRIITATEELLVHVEPLVRPYSGLFWASAHKWMGSSDYGIDDPLLIGATGIRSRTTQEPPNVRAELVRDLRLIQNTDHIVVEMEPGAREIFRDVTAQTLRDIARFGDPGPYCDG